MSDPFFWRWLRRLYGGYFLLLGLASAAQYAGLLPDPHWETQMSPASGAFYLALEKTGFAAYLIVLVWFTSGLAMLFYRTAPFGLVLLAPVMVNIFLADTVLDDLWFWASAHSAPLAALAWRFRRAYYPLFTYSGP